MHGSLYDESTTDIWQLSPQIHWESETYFFHEKNKQLEQNDTVNEVKTWL